MTLKGCLKPCAAALAAVAVAAWGQSAPAWRGYKIADGLPEPACSSVSVNAQGTVLARHLNVPALSRLDGYTVTVLDAPPGPGGRCYESPAGQLWAAASGGLSELREGEWVAHRILEIANEPGAQTSKTSPGVPLCVVRHGRVLFLVQDRLMALNAEDPQRPQTEVLRLASETRLGTFLGLTAARDGGLWISGARGLAKLPGPARNLKADTEWLQIEPAAALALQDFREPREDEAGGVTVLARTGNRVEPVVARFDGREWTIRPTGDERVRFAWSGPGRKDWALTESALLSRADGANAYLRDDELPARRFFDMAMEPVGTFWLATSDGLFRYAPPSWQTQAALQSARGPIQGLTEDGDGRLWFVSGGEVHRLDKHDHEILTVPETARRLLQTVQRVVSLANGTLLFETENQLLRFHPSRGDISPVEPENADQIRFLGVLKNGLACIERWPRGTAELDRRLETFDGDQFQAFPGAPPVPDLGAPLLTAFQAAGGDLWAAAETGVACLRGNQWKAYLAVNDGAPESARYFAEAADGRIWAATTDKLWVFDGRNWVLARLGFDQINGLVRGRDDTLWVASNSGLHRLTAAGWVENGVEEGLPSVAVRSITEDRRGRIWVGTSQGVSLHHPEVDLDPPRTTILTAPDQSIPEGSALTIAFTARDKWKYTPARRLLYSYRLDDRDWSLFQELDSVTLTELPAGPHSFSVRAIDRNGNLETKPAQITFAVAQPWFKETRLVLIASAGTLTALFFAALAFNRHLRLRRSYAEVERKVTERTRELEIANRELVHSQKMRALGTLAAGIAHDFNNILSIVKGSAQIIEDNLDNPAKIQTRLDRIRTVVEQGAGIVQAMLGFSRNSDGTAEPCDINTVVDSTITLLGDRFLRDVEVHFERGPQLPAIPVAKDLVQQVLLNFIFNAAESMQERKNVVVSTANSEKLPASLFLKPAEATTYIAISVSDSGCGIPPENLPRIFEPFFTTKALSTRRGTGLGLSMAYELAKRLDAGLGVESAVGQGSTFTLILPVTANPE